MYLKSLIHRCNIYNDTVTERNRFFLSSIVEPNSIVTGEIISSNSISHIIYCSLQFYAVCYNIV